MKRKIKKWTAMLMAVIMLAGMAPVTAQAEEAAVESSQEAVQEEEEKPEAATEEEKEPEETTEAADEPAAEIPVPVEESTTEISTEGTYTEADSAVSDADAEAASEPEDTEVPEEEQKEEMELQPEELEHAKVVPLGASDSRTIYSDGSWSGGTVWYVKSGSSKHYVFCLEKGKTMYSGRYSGDITTGYSGKSAFKKAVALNYFYKSNGSSWSGKKNYGIAQEVIWDQTGFDTAGKLTTYINHAWNLTDLNSGRKSGSGTFSTLLIPVSTSSDRKTMIAGIKKTPVQLNEPVDGVCTDKITLPGSSWKYFAKGGYSGSSSDISVVGIFDDNGNAVSGSSASVDTSGNLNLKVTPDTDKGDSKEHPLTVLMSVKFDYQGSNSIRYVKTADGKQNLTYDASFNTDGYFAIQVFSDIPDWENAKVDINKVDEYGNFVPGCTFRLTGINGEALANKVEKDEVINGKGKYFKIEYPGEYQIVETDVPDDGEYALNTTPFTFTAKRTDDNKIVLSATLISDDGSREMVMEEPSFTYTCVNQFNEGAAELVKTGNTLVGYDKASGKFVYEQRKLEGVKFAFYAAEDIYANEELVFSAGEEITNNRYWGGKYNILNPRYHRVKISGKEVYERNEFGLPVTNVYTDSNGKLGISGLPAGDYYCMETGFLPGFSRIPKRYEFTVEPGKTVQINGTSGILNEQAPADGHIYKVDADTNQPLSNAEFTIYADVANTNYDGKAIFSKAGTVPVVTSRNLATGEENIEEGVWVPIRKVTTGTDGMAEFEDLPAGRYLVAETKAPEGYTLAEETYTFTHSYEAEQGSSGYNFEHTFKDKRMKGSIRIIKTDGKTGELLKGVEFDLLDEREQVIGSYTTDKNGEIFIDNLELGTYHIKETKAKKGYRLDDSVQKVVISKDSLNQAVKVKNYRSETSITARTDTTIKGGGSVRTGDMSHIGFIMVLFLISSAGAAFFIRKIGVKPKKVSVKGKKFIMVLVLTAGILVFGGLTVRAAGLKEISSVELTDAVKPIHIQYETLGTIPQVKIPEKSNHILKRGRPLKLKGGIR